MHESHWDACKTQDKHRIPTLILRRWTRFQNLGVITFSRLRSVTSSLPSGAARMTMSLAPSLTQLLIAALCPGTFHAVIFKTTALNCFDHVRNKVVFFWLAFVRWYLWRLLTLSGVYRDLHRCFAAFPADAVHLLDAVQLLHATCIARCRSEHETCQAACEAMPPDVRRTYTSFAKQCHLMYEEHTHHLQILISSILISSCKY